MEASNVSSDMCFPKIEVDSESEGKRDSRMTWTSDTTKKLIDTLEKDCRELWDVKHPLNRHRWARLAKHDYLANMFGTTAEEINRKIHNLRTQLNNELRKIKRRQSSASTGGGEGSSNGGSGWEYFDALSFLLRSTGGEPFDGDAIDGVNLALWAHGNGSKTAGNITSLDSQANTLAEVPAFLSPEHRILNSTGGNKLAEFQADEEKFGIAARSRPLVSPKKRHKSLVATSVPNLAEFQADEEEEFGIAARARSLVNGSPQNKHRPRVAASAPPPLPPSAHPLMWPEEAVPGLRPSINADECQIFGDFVASELRMLRSDESRKKLKRMIQKAILQIGEDEDVNIISG